MASIHEPTGNQLAVIFPLRPGEESPLGGILSAAVVDQYRATQGQRSITYRAYQHIADRLTDGGYDPNNLTQDQANWAQSAIEWIAILEFSKFARTIQPVEAKGCESHQDFKTRIQMYQFNACDALHKIGVTSPDYCTLPADLMRGQRLCYCND